MKRKTRRFLKNVMLSFSVVIAMMIFICASTQMAITNIGSLIAMFISAGYILIFCYANGVTL